MLWVDTALGKPPIGFTPARLIVLQPISLCNLDCHYCKLPERKVREVMAFRTPAAIISNLARDNLLDQNVTICWHLGEPLLLDIEYYRSACADIKCAVPNGISPRFTFQTNGTNIDDDWCKFFCDINADIGLSLDGPAHIHDKHRPTWAGGASHHKTEEALRLLQSNRLQFHIISVLDRISLIDAHEFYGYFKQLGVTKLCLNIEESEGTGVSQFLQEDSNFIRLGDFFRDLYRIVLDDPDPIWIREFDGMQKGILLGHNDIQTSQETTLGKIITVLQNGDTLPYTPGFATMPLSSRGDFVIGNLLKGPLSQTINQHSLERIVCDVQTSLHKCRENCEFYSVCGGGSPAHRWSELHSLTEMETRTCQASVQVLARAVVTELRERMETMVNIGAPAQDIVP